MFLGKNHSRSIKMFCFDRIERPHADFDFLKLHIINQNIKEKWLFKMNNQNISFQAYWNHFFPNISISINSVTEAHVDTPKVTLLVWAWLSKEVEVGWLRGHCG